MDRGRTERLTLMCLDHEVVDFAFDVSSGHVTWRDVPVGPELSPLGTRDRSGAMTTPALERWISSRGLPEARPGVSEALGALGASSAEELMLACGGASLSDQYWFRPKGSDLTWRDVNFFERPFPDALGMVLAGPSDSSEGALERIRQEGIVTNTSPDPATGGNLPKRWVIDPDGTRTLLKSGKPANLFQEPMNERAATLACEALLATGDFVPYELREDARPRPRYLSACPCMSDGTDALVPAADVILSAKRHNDLSLYEGFVLICEEHGIRDARTDVSKMLVIDHLLANWDRHWGNFGILVDSESGRWKRMAPVYDTGESLWCDRVLTGSATPDYRRGHPIPFSTDQRCQMERYAEDLSWLDVDALRAVPDAVVGVLEKTQLVPYETSWLEAVHDQVGRNARDVLRLKRRLEAGRSVVVGSGLARHSGTPSSSEVLARFDAWAESHPFTPSDDRADCGQS